MVSLSLPDSVYQLTDAFPANSFLHYCCQVLNLLSGTESVDKLAALMSLREAYVQCEELLYHVSVKLFSSSLRESSCRLRCRKLALHSIEFQEEIFNFTVETLGLLRKRRINSISEQAAVKANFWNDPELTGRNLKLFPGTGVILFLDWHNLLAYG